MFLIKTKKKTPGSRWKNIVHNITIRLKNKPNINFYNNIKFKNTKGAKRKKFLKLSQINEFCSFIKTTSFYIKNIYIDNKLKKEFSLCYSIYNLFKVIATVSIHYPGFKIFNYNNNCEYNYNNSINYLGYFVPVSVIPINFLISNIFNHKNFKNTYVKSSGSVGIRQKIIKKTKLLEIKLPSNTIKLFNINTIALFGTSISLNNQIKFGKWGTYYFRFKKLSVRGVAKNPVDHPNGGRTKAKQPEKSPWGWVAKINK